MLKNFCFLACYEKICKTISCVFQVDFGQRVRLKEIATTGSPLNYGPPRRVVTFTLQFYRDKKWKSYMVDNSVRVNIYVHAYRK